jgi:hypothetical protein
MSFTLSEQISVDFTVSKFATYGKTVDIVEADATTATVTIAGISGSMSLARTFLAGDPENVTVWLIAKLVKAGII